MLPTVPLPSTKLTVEDTLQLQPVRPTTQVIDVLSEFVPGQKLVALIQMQLANGAYRATIAQRDVTLALPFSAKPGDALDLEVVQTEGRIAFAVSKPPSDAEPPATSATTTLSRTGQLIGQLLSLDRPGKETAVVLAGNRPLVADPAAPPAAQATALQRAVAQSGLFYESHQAEWLAGRFPEANLRAEPQAALGRGPAPPPAGLPSAPAAPGHPPAAHGKTAAGETPAALPAAAVVAGDPEAQRTTAARRPTAVGAASAGAPTAAEPGSAPAAGAESAKTAGRPGVAAELAPLVQQQLSSLASNLYAFQGMVWPGQAFRWEIVDEDGGQPARQEGEPERPWKTRLKLLLPSLGDIDASVELTGSDVTITMSAGRGGTPQTLQAGGDRLRERMELAGLRLLALDIRPTEAPADGPDA